jgi:hypothetical protein
MGKVLPAHVVQLLGWAEGIDVILIQQPWLSIKGRKYLGN